jgi:flagellar hook-associated protein 3 FlgL
MRVTQRMIMDNAVQYMTSNLEKLQEYQEKVASGKEFQRVSDNPSGATTALNLRSTLATSQTYLDTADLTDGWMTATDDALSQILDIAKRAIDLTRQGVSDTEGDTQRETYATELNTLLDQAIDVANTTHLGNYIFAGFKTTTTPFSLDDSNGDGEGDTMIYNGDNGVMLRALGPSLTLSQNIDGEATFKDLVAAIINARDALRTNQSDTIQDAVGVLENAFQIVNTASTTNGARLSQTRVIAQRLETTQVELQKLLSEKEDVNMAEAVSTFTYQQTVYQAVLEVGQRAISALSLFDLMS